MREQLTPAELRARRLAEAEVQRSRRAKTHNDSSPQFKGLVEDISTQIDTWSIDKAQEQKLEFVRRIIGQIRTFDRPKAPAFGKRPAKTPERS